MSDDKTISKPHLWKPGTIWTRERVAAFALVFITVLAYRPAWNGQPLWDDDAHITRPDMRSLQGLGKIWTQLGATQQYYPIVHSVFWLEYKLWNGQTLYYHLVNILLHSFSALILIRILRGLGIYGAWVIGAVFALHPIQVESVAWITELKNTLSGVFFLSAAFWYLKFDSERNKLPYAISLCFFIFGLLSKSVIAVLPVSLLAIMWWKRGKLEFKHDIVPIIPLFVTGIFSGLFTGWVERTYIIGSYNNQFTFSILERCLIAGRAFWFYCAKLLWPGELIFIYPHWRISQSQIWQYIFPLGAVILAGICWVFRKRRRSPLAVYIYFTATLFPVLGFFDVYPFMYSFVADHFQYLACIGPITLAVTGLEHAIGRRRRKLRLVGSFIVVGLLWFLTWKQSALYSDSETLFRDVIKKNENCWLAYNNLGLLQWNKGEGKVAFAYFQKALEINPNFAKTHFNIGTMFIQFGNINDAIAHFRKATEIDSAYFEAYHNLGGAFAAIGLVDSAIACYRKALEIKPDFAESSFNLANIYLQNRKKDEAIACYRKALESKPDFVDAQTSLGVLLAGTGNTDEAVLHFRKVLEINPAALEAWFALGNTLIQTGQIYEAVDCYKKALELNPRSIEVCNNLGMALSRLGRMDEAIPYFQKALEINPLEILALQNLAFAYRQGGRSRDAIALLQNAVAEARVKGQESLAKEISELFKKIKMGKS
jgi:tetratricopeptide (TPR) repeat protein